jgi:hypothetical protein
MDVVLEEQHPAFTRLRGDIRAGYTPCRPDLHEIWIRNDLTAFPALEYVVAHEVRHLWQKLFSTDFRDVCQAEGDAYPYGYDVLRRYLDSQGRLTTELGEEIDSNRANAAGQFRTVWPNGSFAIISAPPGR